MFGTRVGERAKYSCDPGFELVGEEKRECQANGEWNGTVPFCLLPCPDLEPPQNGTVTLNGNLPGSLAIYDCDEGFQPKTDSLVRQCLISGRWSGEAVICESKLSCQL